MVLISFFIVKCGSQKLRRGGADSWELIGLTQFLSKAASLSTGF
jgi:hypothetical protein